MKGTAAIFYHRLGHHLRLHNHCEKSAVINQSSVGLLGHIDILAGLILSAAFTIFDTFEVSLFPQSPAICWVVPGNSGDLPPLILLILTDRRTYHQADHLMGGSSLAGMDL